MFDPFGLMKSAAMMQSIAQVAQQLRLPIPEAQLAFEALMPAFALGLGRTTPDAGPFANIMATMAGANSQAFAKGVEIGAATMEAGKQIAAQVFGSSELAAQVAEQAATASGVAVGVVQQMMPAIGAMLGQMGNAAPQANFTNPMEFFVNAVRAAQPQSAAPSPSAPENPWSALAAAFMGKTETPTKTAAPQGDNDLLASALQSGKKIQEAYLDSLSNLLGGFKK